MRASASLPWLFVCFVVPDLLFAREPLVLSDDVDFYVPGYHLEILEDSSRSITLADAMASNDWSDSSDTTPRFFMMDSAFWVRFTIRNESTRSDWVVELGNAYQGYIDYYTTIDGNVLRSVHTGGARPYESRDIDHYFFAFQSQIGPGQTRTVYIRFDSSGGMHEPVLLTLFSSDRFRSIQLIGMVVFAGTLGAVLILIANNLVVYFSMGSRSYLYYVAFLVTVAGFHLMISGLWHVITKTSGPGVSQLQSVFGSAFTATFVLFSRHYLSVRSFAKWLDNVLLGVACIAVILLLCTVFLYGPMVVLAVRGFSIVPILGCLISGCVALRFNRRAAILYLTSFTLMCLGALVLVLQLFELFPANSLTQHLPLGGLLIGLVVFSFALGDRIIRIRAEREEARREALKMQTELDLARKLQQSLLPANLPVIKGVDVGIHYRSMERVGGDYYDFVSSERGLGALIADVSGHGVPAALIVSMVKIAFMVRPDLHELPGELMDSMNRVLHQNTGSGFVTAAYVFANPGTGRAMITTAGHPHILQVRPTDGSLLPHRTRGRILGVFEDAQYVSSEVQIMDGDRIILYTDGIIEAKSPTGEVFGEERWHALAVQMIDMNAQDFAAWVIEQVAAWSGGNELIDDDIAIIVLDFARSPHQ